VFATVCINLTILLTEFCPPSSVSSATAYGNSHFARVDVSETTASSRIIVGIAHSTFKSDSESEPTQKQISLYDISEE
jgi:hypothetical protein